MKQRLGCPECGGEIEERGDVRCYTSGVAEVSDDGHREWIAGDWRAPIETYGPDDPPFWCNDCGRQWSLDELAVPERPVCGQDSHEWVGTPEEPAGEDRAEYRVGVAYPLDAAAANPAEDCCPTCAARLTRAYLGFGWLPEIDLQRFARRPVAA